jgi:hypothetical protein
MQIWNLHFHHKTQNTKKYKKSMYTSKYNKKIMNFLVLISYFKKPQRHMHGMYVCTHTYYISSDFFPLSPPCSPCSRPVLETTISFF